MNQKQDIDFDSFEVDKIIGVDIEPADTSVGIMSADICLTFNTLVGSWEAKNESDNKTYRDKEFQVQLHFSDEQFDNLLDLIEPYIKGREAERKSDEDYSKEMEARFKDD